MDPSQGEKTTMDRETMDPSQGEKTIDLIPKAKGFLEDYFSTWAQWAELEKMRLKLANLYREDSWMNFDGENIQGKEAICAKLTSLKPSRIQVLKIEFLPLGCTGFFGGTGFDSGTGFNSGGTGFSGGTGLQGVASGCIWLDGKLDFCHFSQMFVLHPTPEGSFDISRSIFPRPGI